MPTRNTHSIFLAVTITLLSLFVLSNISGCQKDKGSKTQTGAGDNGVLSYVPADTIFFIGGLEPISVKESTQMFGENSGVFMEAFKEGLKKPSAANEAPASKMFGKLLLNYFEALEKPDQLAQKLGIDDEMRFAVYSVGTIPVMRMHLKDKAAFEGFIQNSETQAGVQGEVESVGSAKIHKYAFDNTPDAKAVGASFVIGTQDDYAIVTANISKLSQDLNRQILGEIKPTSTLSKDTVSGLLSKYHFDPRYLLFVDHKQIMRGLTHSDNQFGSMLKAFTEMARKTSAMVAPGATPAIPPADAMDSPAQTPATPPAPATEENPLAKIQTPACQKELSAKVETWPRTVGGYTTLDFKSKPAIFDFKGIVEINDAKFTQSLKSLRGVIPTYVSDRNVPMVFGLGVGINVDAIAPFVTQFIQEFTAQDYQCEFLADMKKNMLASNPAMGIAMMTGMASGVYGVSASLLSFEGNIDPTMQMPPDIKKLQAIVTVSAKNPQMLLMMLSKMQPGMPPIQLPADGKAIDFPMPLPSPEPIKLAQKGNHIVAYMGSDAAALADTLQKQKLEGNGLFSVNLDYQKYFKLLSSGMQANAANMQDPEFQKMMKMFEAMKFKVIEGMDVSDDGLEFNAAMTAN